MDVNDVMGNMMMMMIIANDENDMMNEILKSKDTSTNEV